MRLLGGRRIAKNLTNTHKHPGPRPQPSRVSETMDKISIPKLRRKPKPPAIETSIDRNSTIHPGPDDAASRGSKSPKFPSRMSPFRRLRGGKRARSCSPAASLLGEPVAAVVSHGTRAANKPGEEQRLKIPAFLTQSDYELHLKFQDVQIEESDRMQPGARAGEETTKWSFYRTQNTPDKGHHDRYGNIRPYSHNRVVLNVPEGEFDYVNASTVAMPASNETAPAYRYIAMQGPTDASFDYVWRMIAEQTTTSAVIVQLTAMIEGEARKCSQYFPFTDEDKMWTLNEGDAWNDAWTATLSYDSMELLCDGAIERRKLLLHVGGEDEPRTVWHFLYLRWPDFGIPALTDIHSFFELMKLSREHAGDKVDEPRIIHCSAGVGRTGTFMCLEHLMRELEMGAFDAIDSNDADADLVYETVDTLRQQRRYMVQSVAQYMFVYQVMRKLWGEKYGMLEDEVTVRGAAGQPALKRFERADSVFDESASNSSFMSEGGN